MPATTPIAPIMTTPNVSLLIVSLLIAKRSQVLSDLEAGWGREAVEENHQEWPVREEEH